MFPANVVDLISKVSPVLGSLLGGPAGSLVGYLISSLLGVKMNDPIEVARKLADQNTINQLKELELQLTDLQNAREMANKETGALRYQRFLLAIMAMAAVFLDIYFINTVDDDMLKQILIIMLVILIWDIRQIYKFFFGSGDDIPTFLLKNKK